MKTVKTELDPKDLDIILADDLIDTGGNFYHLTFRQALEEQTKNKPLLACSYVVDEKLPKSIHNFVGWTEDRVIFSVVGIGLFDTLLDSLPRNPPEEL